MKKVKILVASVLFCAMGYVGYTTYKSLPINEASKFIKANLEALTQGEGEEGGWVYCRCHNDQHCYSGNAISFRPACSYSVNGNGGSYANCRDNDRVCKNLH